MAGVNKAIIVGHLGADPEYKTVGSDNGVANFSIATSRKWKDRDGEWVEDTQWHRIVVWGRLAETCDKYLAKGRQVYIEGRIETRKWEDRDGNDRYTTEIVAQVVQFLGGGDDDRGGNRRGGGRRDRDRGRDRGRGSSRRDSRRETAPSNDLPDEQLPF